MTSIKLDSIKRDLRRETDGEWQTVPEWDGVKLLVRSLNCVDYRNARDILMSKMTRRLNRIPTGPELDAELPKLYARFLLRGWEGFDQPYSPELAMTMLTNPEFGELADKVVQCAARVGQVDVEFIEAAAKNSEPPSATT